MKNIVKICLFDKGYEPKHSKELFSSLLRTYFVPLVRDSVFCYFSQGYFQLKANPGAWMLKLRDGRSSELYQIARLVFYITIIHNLIKVCTVCLLPSLDGEA